MTVFLKVFFTQLVTFFQQPMNLTGKTNRNSGEVAHHQGEEEHEEHEVPCWLQSTLAVLIVTNILAYFLVTWSTMRDLDMQIAVLRSKRSSILPEDITTTTTSTDWSALKMKGGENGTVSNSTTVFGTAAMSTVFTLGHIHQTSEVIEVRWFDGFLLVNCNPFPLSTG